MLYIRNTVLKLDPMPKDKVLKLDPMHKDKVVKLDLVPKNKILTLDHNYTYRQDFNIGT